MLMRSTALLPFVCFCGATAFPGETDKEAAEAFVGLANKSLAAGEYDKCSEWLKKSREKFDSAEAAECMARCHEAQGHAMQALAEYRRALGLASLSGGTEVATRVQARLKAIEDITGTYRFRRKEFIALCARAAESEQPYLREMALADLIALGAAPPMPVALDAETRAQLAARHGGGPKTEKAVEAALAWLQRHQEPDGRWEARKWESSRRTDPGITGLALLAFLRAGYSDPKGKYGEAVRKAAGWIVKQQQADGSIGKGFEGSEYEGDIGYHHSICGLALAEVYGATREASARSAAQKAVDYAVRVHQLKDSGWRYVPGQDGGADMSVTGWFAMQLHGARTVGLEVPDSAMGGALRFTNSVSDQSGRCRYQPVWITPTQTMTSAGMLVRLYTGSKPTDALVAGGASYLLQKPPLWDQKDDGVDMYYWFFGTAAMSEVGGEAWKTWNDALVPALCAHQRTGEVKDGGPNDVDGSWDPVSVWSKRGGRVYTAAIGALSLEMYYRIGR